jgi:hypothetical protein
MLGGRRSFAEGGYTGTPVAEVLPLAIEGAAQPMPNLRRLWFVCTLSLHRAS